MPLEQLSKDEVLKQMKCVFSLLSNSDALTIFSLAAEGIERDLNAPRRLGMTEKRYYTRLRELTDAGLVSKQGGLYKHTGLGSLVFEHQYKGLGHLLTNRRGLELLDELKRNAKVTAEDLDRITPAILGDLEYSLDLTNLKPVKIIKTYDDIISTIQEYIERMKDTMYLATRYIDFRVVQSILRNVPVGTKVYIINADRDDLTSKVQMLSNVLAHPGTFKLFLDMVKKNRDRIQIKHSKIPYSFAVIDSEEVGIEIVNPADPKNFFMGLQFRNHELASKMIGYFNKIWIEAERDPMTVFVEQAPEELTKEFSTQIKG